MAKKGDAKPTTGINLLITGEHATGKTSLIQAFVGQQFKALYYPTIDINKFVKKVDIEGSEVTLTCWDFAGSEGWDNMPPLKGAVGAFIVGDITREHTFAQIAKIWAPDLKKHTGDKIPIILVANKCDSARKVSEADLEKYKSEVGAVGVIETSAKNGTNVNDAFNTITRNILGR
jgi:small GTP-binding protein